MNNELLLLIKKHTDTLIEQTRTKPQEALEFKMNKQVQTFSFNPPIILVEEGEWLLAVSSFKATNSVFNITDENNIFSISTPDHWNSEDSEELINELNKLLELRSQNGIELHVEQVRKKGLILLSDYSLSSLGTFKNEIVEELKNAKYNDLEDLVYRFQLTYDEIIDILDLKKITGSTKGYTLPPGVYEIIDFNFLLKSLFPKEVKVNITIDDVKLKPNLTTNKTIKFSQKSFFYTILGFTESHSGELGDIP